MQGRDDDVMVLVLEVGQLLGQEACVMVVNEGDRSHHEGVGSNHGGANQAFANEIAKGFGAVLVTLACNEAVEAAKPVSGPTLRIFPSASTERKSI